MMTTSLPTKLGHSMRQHFQQDEQWVNLNHGSYGTFPKQVAQTRTDISHRIETAPDRFFRYEYKALLNESRERLAQYLHVPVDECVLVQNATTALDTIVRNLTVREKDVVLCFETIYDAVEKSLLCVQELHPCLELIKVGHKCSRDFRLPMSHADIVSLFVETVEAVQHEGYMVKAAVFETIISIPGVRLPFEELTRVCRNFGIWSIIDGAHGIGQIPLNLASLDADFFVSNCHKWLYTPRSCALLHVPKRNQHLIRNTVPTSYLFVPRSGSFIREASRHEAPSAFVELFQNIATMDNTPFYCISAALDFREQVCGGEAAIFDYTKQIAQQGADLIARHLDTYVMGPAETAAHDLALYDGMKKPQPPENHNSTYIELRDCAVATVALPIKITGESRIDGESGVTVENAPSIASWMQETLTVSNTTASVFVYDERLWVRIMGQIYLELSDFEWFAGVLSGLCSRVKNGEPAIRSSINKSEQP